MRRREFLEMAGTFVVSASASRLLGCASEDGAARGAYTFPQGVASGDPRPGSVMLWTRVEAVDGDDGPISLTVEVSETDTFETVLVEHPLEAARESDHTVRVLVEGLEADRTYYYRFRAGQDEGPLGRTRTAPAKDADTPVRLAWASCQDRKHGFYGAWRRLLNDDLAAAEADRIHFVLFLGDFIYETLEVDPATAHDDDFEPLELVDREGNPRATPSFPDGAMREGSETEIIAVSLDDYRHLYKSYLSDPDLQAARARWPFVQTWDDHEFSNDCWQSQANYTRADGLDEPSQRRKLASNRAWFEYVPCVLSEAADLDGDDSPARDFATADLEDASFDADGARDEPNNAAAIGSITIHRRLRFGKHLELVVTDCRSYRSDHAVDEAVTVNDILVFEPRNVLSLEAVNTMDAGMTANGGNPPDEVAGYENVRKASPPGTMLGAEQKTWWKGVLRDSSATWKVWGNSVPLLRLRLDASDVSLFPADLVMGADGWDGYPSERRELMAYLRDEGITNVVSLSGDHHAHYAGLVFDDYDGADPRPVMWDFATAGISSDSQFSEVLGGLEAMVPPALAPLVAPVMRVLTFDATAFGGDDRYVPNLNALVRYGSPAANAGADTGDLDAVEAARNPDVNPHLKYADAAANGYGLARFDADGAEIELVTVERPITDVGEDGAEVRCTARFTLSAAASIDDVTLDEPEIEGQKPWPLR